MRPLNDIEKALKRAHIETHAKMDERVLSDVLNAFEKSRTQKPTATQSVIFMEWLRRNRIVKLAAVAVIVLCIGAATTVLVTGNGTNTNVAFGEVREGIQSAQTISCKILTESTRTTEYAPAPIHKRVLYKEPGLLRMEMDLIKGDGKPVTVIVIVNYMEGEILSIVPEMKRARRQVFGKLTPHSARGFMSIQQFKQFKSLVDGSALGLGERYIDGQKASGFQITSGYAKGVEIWADPASGDPILISIMPPSREIRITVTDLVLNPDLDDSLFSLEVAKDYEVETLDETIKKAIPSDESASVELPEELATIVKSNSESLRKLSICTATIEEHRWFRRDEKEASYKRLLSIWFKDSRIREDAIVEPTETALPQRIVIEDPGRGTRSILRPQDSRQIATPEACMSYSPGYGAMTIVRGDADLPFGRKASMLHKYAAYLHGITLEQKVRTLTTEGYAPSIQDADVDGVSCKQIEWDFPNVEMALKIWVVPSKGHMIKKVQTFHKGHIVHEWIATLREYGKGLFWFEEVTEKEWHRGSLAECTTIKIKELNPDAPVDDELFTLKGLNVPFGTEIQDRIVGLKFNCGAAFGIPHDFLNFALQY